MQQLYHSLEKELELPIVVSHTKKKVNEVEDFFDLKTLKSDSELELYLENVGNLMDNSQNFLSKIQKSLEILQKLQNLNESVAEKTRELQAQTLSIIKEEEQLSDLANDLELKLSYFNSLEMVIKLLSSSGQEITLEKEFIPSLSLLDHCSEFLSKNLDFQEAGVYLIKTKQSMTRSMMLIKMHIVNSLRTLAGDIRDLLISDVGKNVQISLFYTKFKNLGVELKPLVYELESRAMNNLEFMALLKDSISTYFDTRKSLIGPFIHKNIQEMKHESILDYIKTGCAYMIQICEDEYKLFHDFFELEHEELMKYLESLSLILYDKYRPLILKENKIDELVDLCQSLLSYFIDAKNEKGASVLDLMGQEDKLEDTSSAVKFLARKTLEDAQARLVFRAQEFIQAEIMNFTPRMEDIELFARGRGLPKPNLVNSVVGVAPVIDDLYDGENDKHQLESVSTEKVAESEMIMSPNQLSSGKLVYGGGEYYPTLQRALYILGRLYGSTPMSVFEDISAEAINHCRYSLIKASDILISKQTKLDGQLFLIKNLLMLREQIIPYDAQFIIKEERLDFGGMIDALTSILRSSWTILSVSNIPKWGKSIADATSPTVIENYSDAKELLDMDLKRVCEDVILDAARTAIEPISSFMLKVSAFRLRSAGRSNAELLSKQNFASPDHVIGVFTQFKQVLGNHLEFVSKKMNNYLGDKKTETILLRVIRSNILDNYQAFYEVVTTEYESQYWNSVSTVLEIAILIDQVTGRRSSVSDLQNVAQNN